MAKNARAMVKMKLKLPEHVGEEKRLYNECAYAFGGNPWGHPEDYNQAWKERERRAQSRPWKVPQTPPKSPRGTQEDKGYEEDMEQERGSLSGHEESSGKDSEKEQEQQRPRFAKSLANSVRFCVFNIDSTTKADFWEILKTRLSQEILAGVVRVENVLQPNGKKRMDMWIKAENASKLKSAMNLGSAIRRNRTQVDH